MSLIKTSQQIAVMREGGLILAEALTQIATKIKPDVDVWDLETYFLDFCNKNKVVAACKGYDSDGYMSPFPTGLCVSMNNQAVHCFPKKGVILKQGDVVTIDTVIKHKNMHVDASFAKGVGTIDKNAQNLIETSKSALLLVEQQVKPEISIGYLAHTMQRYVESKGLNVLRDYAGHGIGEDMHEMPEVPCYGDPHDGMRLISGMTICIEALTCEGSPKVVNVSEWETKMKDNKRFLQFEHTILVTDTGYEVLTPFEV